MMIWMALTSNLKEVRMAGRGRGNGRIREPEWLGTDLLPLASHPPDVTKAEAPPNKRPRTIRRRRPYSDDGLRRTGFSGTW